MLQFVDSEGINSNRFLNEIIYSMQEQKKVYKNMLEYSIWITEIPKEYPQSLTVHQIVLVLTY